MLRKTITKCLNKPALVRFSTEVSTNTMSEIEKLNKSLSPAEKEESLRLGNDFFLDAQKKKYIENVGLYFEDANQKININDPKIFKSKFMLKYMKNMQLINDYQIVFREFLQAVARYDQNGLKLVCEPRFLDYFNIVLDKVKKGGYVIDIESLRLLHDYKLLNYEIYKNLKVNRYENLKPNISYHSGLLGSFARYQNEDYSFATNLYPFILANTMLITTPMKLGVFNQNLSKKLHGKEEIIDISYVVRFELEMTLSDFFWILPNPNKPSRVRRIKITDFNNIMRGNPFNEDFNIQGNTRFNFMKEDDKEDKRVKEIILNLNKTHQLKKI